MSIGEAGSGEADIVQLQVKVRKDNPGCVLESASGVFAGLFDLVSLKNPRAANKELRAGQRLAQTGTADHPYRSPERQTPIGHINETTYDRGRLFESAGHLLVQDNRQTKTPHPILFIIRLIKNQVKSSVIHNS